PGRARRRGGSAPRRRPRLDAAPEHRSGAPRPEHAHHVRGRGRVARAEVPMVQRLVFRRRRPPAGSWPGELVLPEGGSPRQIHVIQYGPDRIEERDVTEVDALARFRDGPECAWIEVNGLGDEAGLRRIAALFGIHPLALADVVNVPQRPKLDSYEKHDLLI